jgi:hypothetical protein
MASRRPRPLPPRSPARHVRELAPFVVLVCACGAAVRESGAVPLPSAAQPSATSVVRAFPPDTVAAFDALAARASSLATGMREVTRRETGTDAVDLTTPEARDTCVRVAFQATAPVTVKLTDEGGNLLATTEDAVTDGVLAARGPVCVRKGDVVRGLAEGTGARVRWMAWEAR